MGGQLEDFTLLHVPPYVPDALVGTGTRRTSSRPGAVSLAPREKQGHTGTSVTR
jgi:hypothetical protein